MRIPVITGVIDRRILANWRCDPAALARLPPVPFRPKLAGGYGVAGICPIRLTDIRPLAVPDDLAAASAFFEGGSHGVLPGRQAGQLDGLELRGPSGGTSNRWPWSGWLPRPSKTRRDSRRERRRSMAPYSCAGSTTCGTSGRPRRGRARRARE